MSMWRNQLMRSEYRNYPAATEMQSDLAGNYLTRAPKALLILMGSLLQQTIRQRGDLVMRNALSYGRGTAKDFPLLFYLNGGDLLYSEVELRRRARLRAL